MKTVILEVSDLKTASNRFIKAWKAGKREDAHIGFASPELLFRTLTNKRWEIIRAMTGAGPLSIRETARRVNRDVKAVHADVHALLNAGVLCHTDDGRIVFPFDTVRVNLTLTAA